MSDRSMVRVYEPVDATEVLMIRAALGPADVPFPVENEHYLFGGGGGAWTLNDGQVFVVMPEDRADEARRLIGRVVGDEISDDEEGPRRGGQP